VLPKVAVDGTVKEVDTGLFLDLILENTCSFTSAKSPSWFQSIQTLTASLYLVLGQYLLTEIDTFEFKSKSGKIVETV